MSHRITWVNFLSSGKLGAWPRDTAHSFMAAITSSFVTIFAPLEATLSGAAQLIPHGFCGTGTLACARLFLENLWTPSAASLCLWFSQKPRAKGQEPLSRHT